MEAVTRTVYGSHLQTCMLLGIPVIIKQYSTLNEKFSIQGNTAITEDQVPHMKYVAIGNGGHRMVVGANGIAKPEPIQHQSTDAALFNHLPFVLRELDNDLPAALRLKYALRRIETHDGISYIAYYLKRLDYSNVVAQMDYKTVSGGVTTSSEFIPNGSNLNPVPPALSSTGVNVTTGDYVSATAKVPFILDESEVTELLNVSNIIYGDDGYAIISEIALCSGVDKIVSAQANNLGTFNFTESIATQVISFVNGFFPMKFSNSGINILLDLGATESLFKLASPTP